VDHGLGDEIVVMGTYDGEWRREKNPVKAEENSTGPEAGPAGDDTKQ
jgi:hypothetical protein